MRGFTESDAISHWPGVRLPLHLEPMTSGVNNRSYLVRSGRESYVLKCYMNVDMMERIHFEHELLSALATTSLPFSVPSPLLAKSGDTTVEISCDGGIHHVALFHRIPGRAASYGDKSEAYRCGQALAFLDQALNAITLSHTVSVPESFGNLSSIHKYVPDPLIAIKQLPVEHELTTKLATIMALVEERWQCHTAGWKTQLIHGDYYPSNTLVDAGKVSGILDFEFSGTGYQAMDFAIGMAAFSAKNWNDGCSWLLLESFAKGYLAQVPLTEEELTATPVLLLKRELSSFIHWLGRMRQGLITLDDMHYRARRLISLHRWLEENQSQLAHRLSGLNVS